MSEFGDSDLSDLESSNAADDDQEYVVGAAAARKQAAATATAAKKKTEQDKFVITGALKPPRPTTYTTQALYDGIHHAHIRLDPDYQRGACFTLFIVGVVVPDSI